MEFCRPIFFLLVLFLLVSDVQIDVVLSLLSVDMTMYQVA